jgi:uncharacterized BrkB/YihY/UPF0761 family membrane protein
VIGSALSQFPIIGDQLTNTAHPLQGSGAGLVIGILVALYGGLGFAVALQYAFNQAWAVPMDRRPDPLFARLRGLGVLGVLGLGCWSRPVWPPSAPPRTPRCPNSE